MSRQFPGHWCYCERSTKVPFEHGVQFAEVLDAYLFGQVFTGSAWSHVELFWDIHLELWKLGRERDLKGLLEVDQIHFDAVFISNLFERTKCDW